MSRQNTFTIVPNPLGMQGLVQRQAGEGPSRPPMTTKQAQKLYRQATRQPRLSKAEQRRRDKEEQERIRKELEKERQTSRARSARERKKATEKQALDEKKRKGLPIVNVRPSQDTISRFLRGNNVGKKRDSDGTELNLRTISEGPESAASETEGASEGEGAVAAIQAEAKISAESIQEPDSPPRASKRLRVLAQDESGKGADDGEAGGLAGEEAAPVRVRDLSDQPSRQSSLAADDPTIEDMVHTQLIEEATAAARSSANQAPSPKQPPTALSTSGHHNPKHNAPAESIPTVTARSLSNETPNKRIRTPSQPRKPLQETAANCQNARRPMEQARSVQPCPAQFKPASNPPPDMRHRAMPPSALMPRFKPQTSAEKGRIERPKFLTKHPRTPAPRPAPGRTSKVVEPPPKSPLESTVPPTSTQLFVLSHLDDLFPTPSQEARELLLPEDSPISVSKPVAPHPPVLLAQKQAPKPEPRPSSGPCASTSASHDGSDQQAGKIDLPFFSTQDFEFSSQDIREVEQGSDTPSKVINDKARNKNLQPANAVGHVRPNAPGRSFSRARALIAAPAQIPKAPTQSRDPSTQHLSAVTDDTRQDVRGPGPLLCCRGGSQVSYRRRTPSHLSSQASRQPSQPSQKPERNTGGKVCPDIPVQVKPQHHPSTIGPGNSALLPSPHPPVPEAASAGFGPEQKQPNPSASPQKKRFFTSSNNEGYHLAKERSLRTLREEDRTREANRREQEQAGRKLREERERKEMEELEILAQQLADEPDEVEASCGQPRTGTVQEEEQTRGAKHREQEQQSQTPHEEWKHKEMEELALQLADELDEIDAGHEETRQCTQRPQKEGIAQCRVGDSLGGGSSKAGVDSHAPDGGNLSQETDYGDMCWIESEMDALDSLDNSAA